MPSPAPERVPRTKSTSAPNVRRVSTGYHYVLLMRAHRGEPKPSGAQNSKPPDLTAPPLARWIEEQSTLHPRIARTSQCLITPYHPPTAVNLSSDRQTLAALLEHLVEGSRIPSSAHKLTGDHSPHCSPRGPRFKFATWGGPKPRPGSDAALGSFRYRSIAGGDRQ